MEGALLAVATPRSDVCALRSDDTPSGPGMAAGLGAEAAELRASMPTRAGIAAAAPEDVDGPLEDGPPE